MSQVRQIHAGYVHWLDVAKGIGILLVIIGHCIFVCHPVIDVFHMPLFFLLAGITSKHKPWNTFLVSKINRIAVPYIFWMIVSAIISLAPHPYSGPFNAPLWFLQTIFVAQIIVNCNRGGKLMFDTVIYLGVITLFCYSVASGMITDFLPFHLSRALMACLYIFLGIKLRSLLLKRSRKSVTGICLLASLMLFSLMFKYLYSAGLQGSFVHLTIYKQHYFLVLLCSVAGILATVFISQLIGRQTCLEWLGRNSLVIMCVHFPFAQVLNVLISQTVWYHSVSGKIILGLMEYVLVTGISVVLTILCKRYIPRLTGYKPIIQVNQDITAVANSV